MFLFQKDVLKSKLFTEKDFYTRFIQDLKNCKKEIIIESPYITESRLEIVLPTLKKLLALSVSIHIITKDPIDHDGEYLRDQATNCILKCMDFGIHMVLVLGNHHRKLAILDRTILWEGSLNILSFNRSKEIMRRIEGKEHANEIFRFLNLSKLI